MKNINDECYNRMKSVPTLQSVCPSLNSFLHSSFYDPRKRTRRTRTWKDREKAHTQVARTRLTFQKIKKNLPSNDLPIQIHPFRGFDSCFHLLVRAGDSPGPLAPDDNPELLTLSNPTVIHFHLSSLSRTEDNSRSQVSSSWFLRLSCCCRCSMSVYFLFPAKIPREPAPRC